MKANSSLAIVRLLREAGSAVDANSIGEVELAMRAGFAPSDIVFSGVGKSPDEIERAVQLGLKAINAESAGELERIDRAAQARGVRAQGGGARQSRHRRRHAPSHLDRPAHQQVRRSARAGTRACIARWRRSPGWSRSASTCTSARRSSALEPIQRGGGSRRARWRESCEIAGIQLDHIDIGGGLGISYDGSRAPTAAEYAAAILPIVASVRAVDCARARPLSSSGAAGGAARARGRPEGCRRRTPLRRARRRHDRADAAHALRRLPPHRRGRRRAPPATLCYDIVGPVCESTDAFGSERRLNRLEVGDLLAILDAGAYGSAMSSNYNRRPLPAEVMVDGGQAQADPPPTDHRRSAGAGNVDSSD